MQSQKRTLQQAIQAFDRDASRREVDTADQQRREVVVRFPIGGWPTLTLERYALGQANTQESYCWWMEFGTPAVCSMKGGSAKKHIIYKQNDGEWYFDRDTYPAVEDAWEAVRSGFVEAFAKAAAGDFDGIDQIESIQSGAALRTKSLHCHFPDQVLPVTSIDHMRHFLRLLGSPLADDAGYQGVRLNRALLAALRKVPGLEGRSTKELGVLLYRWDDPRDQRQIVKIAPGSDAHLWPECEAGGYIRVGWGKVGDLRRFETKEAFRAKFEQEFGADYKNHSPAISAKANEVWTLRGLEPGDLVLANRGTSKVVAVGEVVEPAYEWSADKGHLVHVNWDTSYAQDIPQQKHWAMVTVKPVSQALAAQVLGKKAGPVPQIAPDPLMKQVADALERKGQAILYGPPGTGKTWTARRFAAWWLTKQAGDDSSRLLTDPAAFAEAEQRLSTAQVVRRVWWMVANPSIWNWDQLFKDKRVEFHYGRLQRNYPLARKGDLVVGYKSGTDKRVVALARVARELYEGTDGDQHIDLEPVAKVADGPTYDEMRKDEVLGQSEPMRFRNQGTLFSLTADEFEHLAVVLADRNPDLAKHLDATATIGALTRLTFHPSYSYEDFIEGFRPVDTRGGHLSLRLEDGVFKRVCREAQANPKQAYLVLIDEINRANVAKVFGELITLLERDKRGLMISLPQSKEGFTIPPNVYVLGTMNTADRSIKLLDAALRRRFAFLELMPDPTLLEGGKVGDLVLSEFLAGLNLRVAKREGREKQIGHSFLLDGEQPVADADEFARRFRQEILPLLQEYCYDDYAVLAEYIGGQLVDRDAQMLDDDLLSDPDSLVEALAKEFAIKEVVA